MILAFVIRSFVVQAFKIPSGSMKDTLLVGDHILVSKFTYGIHIPNQIPFTHIQLFRNFHLFQSTPKRGDIIVFQYPRDPTRDIDLIKGKAFLVYWSWDNIANKTRWNRTGKLLE